LVARSLERWSPKWGYHPRQGRRQKKPVAEGPAPDELVQRRAASTGRQARSNTTKAATGRRRRGMRANSELVGAN